MRHYLRSIALLAMLVIPDKALGGLCAHVNKTPPTGMFLEQIRRVIATQAHRQAQLREPLHLEKIHKYFGKDAWNVIWAQPQHYEMGVFVIAAEDGRLRHVALWGGVAFPQDEAQIFAWFVSKAPEAPRDLLRCVAHYLATLEE